MLRLSSASLPANATIAEESGLPYSALVSPLAPSPGLDPESLELSRSLPATKRVSFGSARAPEMGFVPRCYRCAAYISKHCKKTVRVWNCVICGAQNTLPSRYLPAVRDGPAALTTIPELSLRVYDVPVADEVPVTPLAYIFVIDVHGDDAYLDAMRLAVRKALDVVEGESFAGVMLYGDTVQLIDTRPAAHGGDHARAETPATLRPFSVKDLPPDQWLRRTGAKLTDAIIGALSNLSGPGAGAGTRTSLVADPSQEPRRAMGPAVRAALDMVEGAGLTGARVIVMAGGEPNHGDGSLGLRARSTFSPTSNGVTQPQQNALPSDDRFPAPITPFYTEQGTRANMLGAMIDIYLTSRKPVDIASLSPLAQFSGGRLLVYDAGVPAAESSLPNDLWQHLNDPMLIRGLLRVRTTQNVLTHEVYGCGLFRDAEVEDVFRLSCHGHASTLAVEFGLPAKPSSRNRSLPQNAVVVQIAVRGVFVEPGMLPQRVLRIETVLVDTVDRDVRLLWESADANVVATTMFHKAVATADEHGIGAARLLLSDWLAQLVVCGSRVHPLGQFKDSENATPNDRNILYRNEVSSGYTNGYTNGHANGQNVAADKDVDDEQETMTWLDLYEGLRTVPQLVFGLIRSFMFRHEAVAADIRSAMRCIWEDLSPELLSAAAYPKLVSFRNLDGGVSHGRVVEASDVIGWSLPLSSDAVRKCGHDVFLIDALSEVVIYYTAEGCARFSYPPPDGSVLAKVKGQCMRDRPVIPKVVICREGTPAERWFNAHLIEDGTTQAGTTSAQSYKQFMRSVKHTAAMP